MTANGGQRSTWSPVPAHLEAQPPERAGDLGSPATAADLTGLGLPQLFSPAEAAMALRTLGLTDITECALRTRAYRKQVPFHMNARRITFTLDDLREIAEGEALRPLSPTTATMPGAIPRPVPRRPPMIGRTVGTGDPWRARRPHQPGRRSLVDGGGANET